MAVLARNKQLALCALLATRSAFRAPIEGTPVNPGDAPNPPQSGDDIVARVKANLPAGITSDDIDQVFLDDLFVAPSSPAAPNQVNNVATDIFTIMTALDLQYDPHIPDCPKAAEINPLTTAILDAIA
jgi:hypothetical protein